MKTLKEFEEQNALRDVIVDVALRLNADAFVPIELPALVTSAVQLLQEAEKAAVGLLSEPATKPSEYSRLFGVGKKHLRNTARWECQRCNRWDDLIYQGIDQQYLCMECAKGAEPVTYADTDDSFTCDTCGSKTTQAQQMGSGDYRCFSCCSEDGIFKAVDSALTKAGFGDSAIMTAGEGGCIPKPVEMCPRCMKRPAHRYVVECDAKLCDECASMGVLTECDGCGTASELTEFGSSRYCDKCLDGLADQPAQ